MYLNQLTSLQLIVLKIIIGKINFFPVNFCVLHFAFRFSEGDIVSILGKSRLTMSTAEETRLLEHDLCAGLAQEVLLL